MKYLRRNNWFQIKHNGGTKVKDISYIYTAGNKIKTAEILLSSLRKISQQAGAELCKAQVSVSSFETERAKSQTQSRGKKRRVKRRR